MCTAAVQGVPLRHVKPQNWPARPFQEAGHGQPGRAHRANVGPPAGWPAGAGTPPPASATPASCAGAGAGAPGRRLMWSGETARVATLEDTSAAASAATCAPGGGSEVRSSASADRSRTHCDAAVSSRANSVSRPPSIRLATGYGSPKVAAQILMEMGGDEESSGSVLGSASASTIIAAACAMMSSVPPRTPAAASNVGSVWRRAPGAVSPAVLPSMIAARVGAAETSGP